MSLPLTKKRLLKIWWAVIWRQTLFTFMASLLVGMLAGFIMGFFDFSYETIELTAQIISLPLIIFLSLFAVWLVLKKDFGEFKIELIKK